MRLLLGALLVLASCTPGGTPATPSPTVSSLPSDACHVAAVTFCVLNPDVTQATISTTICVSGWTATIRPPSNYTSQLKQQQIAAEHLSDTNPADYEEDHRVALELGGAPRDPMNLSPEPHSSSFVKDADENAFKRAVCAGSQTLQQAQAAFVSKWLAAYPGYLR